MRLPLPPAVRGFTLIELLTALFILSLLALMSYRGLAAVLDARDHVRAETEKWRKVAAFFARFEQDVQLAIPRSVRTAAGEMPAWVGRPEPADGPMLEFSRSAAVDSTETPRRTGYRLNEKQEVELWVWPGLDAAPQAVPSRYAVLSDVTVIEMRYLNMDSAWIDAWPPTRIAPAIPRAVWLRIVLSSGEEIIRVFALNL